MTSVLQPDAPEDWLMPEATGMQLWIKSSLPPDVDESLVRSRISTKVTTKTVPDASKVTKA